MGWREDLGNFDLTRLTFVGWLVFLLSVGVGVGGAIVLGFYWRDMFGPPANGSRPYRLPGLVGVAGAIGFFFAAKGLLQLAGIRLMHPSEDLADQATKQAIAQLRQRVSRARKWRLFFLLLIPLGLVVPCGIGLALGDAADSTALTIVLVAAFVLPVVGLAGWLLMIGDVRRHAEALAAAELAETARMQDE
jgi:hypothetical protein